MTKNAPGQPAQKPPRQYQSAADLRHKIAPNRVRFAHNDRPICRATACARGRLRWQSVPRRSDERAGRQARGPGEDGRAVARCRSARRTARGRREPPALRRYRRVPDDGDRRLQSDQQGPRAGRQEAVPGAGDRHGCGRPTDHAARHAANAWTFPSARLELLVRAAARRVQAGRSPGHDFRPSEIAETDHALSKRQALRAVHDARIPDVPRAQPADAQVVPCAPHPRIVRAGHGRQADHHASRHVPRRR